MDLKIKDVAELLNVSEKTIRRWLADGKIPAYRLNSQYRFSRIEIENWVLSCRLSKQESGFLDLTPQQRSVLPGESAQQDLTRDDGGQAPGMQQFSLYRAIHKGGIYSDVPGETKGDIIRGTMKLVAGILGRDADVLSELLLDREKLMPTALNHGIAVPHTREFVFDGPFDVAVIVFPKKPIEYGALDGEPVHTLFFLFASGDKRHLHLLAKIAHLSSNPKALDFFKQRPDKQQCLEFVRTWESSLAP